MFLPMQPLKNYINNKEKIDPSILRQDILYKFETGSG